MVLVIEGLSSDHFLANQSMFPNLKSLLEHKVELMTPAVYGGSIIHELSTVPLTGTKYKELIIGIENCSYFNYALQFIFFIVLLICYNTF